MWLSFIDFWIISMVIWRHLLCIGPQNSTMELTPNKSQVVIEICEVVRVLIRVVPWNRSLISQNYVQMVSTVIKDVGVRLVYWTEHDMSNKHVVYTTRIWHMSILIQSKYSCLKNNQYCLTTTLELSCAFIDFLVRCIFGYFVV